MNTNSSTTTDDGAKFGWWFAISVSVLISTINIFL